VTPKLLLADDSVTIQRVIELTFADEDVQVVAVGDGRQAIERAKSERPDIVLADVGMPERDGYEVAAFIKGDPQLKHIPVLLLTGAFEPIDEVRAKAVGCDGVLVKPFEPQMVIGRVRDLLAGKRPAEVSAPRPAPGPTAAPAGGTELLDSVPPVSLDVTGGSLEDYFDRLDAALASKAAPSPPPPAAPASPSTLRVAAPPPVTAAPKPAPSPAALAAPAPAAAPAAEAAAPRAGFAPAPAVPEPNGALDLGGWDPATAVESAATSPAPPAARPPARPAEPIAAAPAATPAAAETRDLPSLRDAFAALLSAEAGHQIAPLPKRAEPPSSELIDEIASRVIARMGDDSMRTAVLDAAERLVREEIARIKAQN
jgi:CheY-like chemotaxis protein